MSAPNTNIDVQQRRHRGPLIGISIAVALVLAGFVWWLSYEVETEVPAAPETSAPPPVSTIEPETEMVPPSND